MLKKSYLFENYSLSNSEQINISFVLNVNLNNEKEVKGSLWEITCIFDFQKLMMR